MDCLYCGKPVPPKEPGRGGPQAKYCCVECKRKAAAARQIARYHQDKPDAGTKSKPRIGWRICAHCGEVYRPKANNQRFCSQACRDAAQTQRDAARRQQRNEARRRARHRKTEEARAAQAGRKLGNLNDTLAMLREKGQSYADYQKAQTLKLFAHVEL